jgi:hypothetical protein
MPSERHFVMDSRASRSSAGQVLQRSCTSRSLAVSAMKLSTKAIGWTARAAALLYATWAAFHVKVAWDIMQLGLAQTGIAQGRTFQLAAYMLTIALFVLIVAVTLNWRNSVRGYWLNLCVAGWADAIWVLVVVLPGYVSLVRGFLPPAIFLAAAIASTIARQAVGDPQGDAARPT